MAGVEGNYLGPPCLTTVLTAQYEGEVHTAVAVEHRTQISFEQVVTGILETLEARVDEVIQNTVGGLCMNHVSGRDYDPSAWARERQERIQRAALRRQQRQSGSPDENHTFKPHLQAKREDVTSRLPLGARQEDQAAPRRGSYDLSKLEDSMETAFVYGFRDTASSESNACHEGIATHAGEQRDSLDRLTVTAVTSAIPKDSSRISRTRTIDMDRCLKLHQNSRLPPPPGLYRSATSRRLPPPPRLYRSATSRRLEGAPCGEDGSPTNAFKRSGQRGDKKGQMYTPRHAAHGGVQVDSTSYRALVLDPSAHHADGNVVSGEDREGICNGDALSHEIDQRPYVRGKASAEAPTRSYNAEGTSEAYSWDACARLQENGTEGNGLSAHDTFAASLRTGRGRVPKVDGESGLRRHGGGKPEWNSDTAGTSSLGAPPMMRLPDESAVAVKVAIKSGQGRPGVRRHTDPGYRGVRIREGPRHETPPGSSCGELRGLDRPEEEGEQDVEAQAGTEQLQERLSLLKKKMHSQDGQLGIRRSHSAGSRAGQYATKYPSRRYQDKSNAFAADHALQSPGIPSQPQLHVTTGSAPAKMPVSNAAHSSSARSGRRKTSMRPAGAGAGAANSFHNVDPCTAVASPPPQDAVTDKGLRSRFPLEATIAATAKSELRQTYGYDNTQDTHEHQGRSARATAATAAATTTPISYGSGGWGSGSGSGRRSSHQGCPWRSNSVLHNAGLGRSGDDNDLPQDAFPQQKMELVECGQCRRKFLPEALERHAGVCKSVFLYKRKAFDAAQMRIRGTELEKFLITTKGTKSWKRAAGVEAKTAFTGRGRVSKKGPRNVDEIRVGQAGGAKPSKWRVQSTQFREAIRQARMVTGATKSGKGLADVPSLTTPYAAGAAAAPDDPSLVPCPHCGRRFNEVAGERHIRICKDIKAKPSSLKKGSGKRLGYAARAKAAANTTRGARW